MCNGSIHLCLVWILQASEGLWGLALRTMKTSKLIDSGLGVVRIARASTQIRSGYRVVKSESGSRSGRTGSGCVQAGLYADRFPAAVDRWTLTDSPRRPTQWSQEITGPWVLFLLPPPLLPVTAPPPPSYASPLPRARGLPKLHRPVRILKPQYCLASDTILPELSYKETTVLSFKERIILKNISQWSLPKDQHFNMFFGQFGQIDSVACTDYRCVLS